MRRILSVGAIVLGALSVVCLIVINTRPSTPTTRAVARRDPTASDSGPDVTAVSEQELPKPAPALGRVGGTLPDTLVDPRLLAEKSRRTLTVFSDGKPVKTYRTALGSAPVGDKTREGDGRTPEGVFYICSKNPESRYGRSLGISYPTAEDAERGIRDKLISKREHRAILDALRHYQRPPWSTRLGGEIMVHGGGTASDWTQGCLALSDTDIDELYPLIPTGTEIEVRP